MPAKPGKPNADNPPSHMSYHFTAEIGPDAAAVSRRERRAGRFILASNDLDADTFSAAEV
ncbi:MAG: hypothetical protein F6K30_14880 [Cyanothece sp. SIO2G6]|nr:hypothetical protein [Cyanothece sp. SIO2G6]